MPIEMMNPWGSGMLSNDVQSKELLELEFKWIFLYSKFLTFVKNYNALIWFEAMLRYS